MKRTRKAYRVLTFHTTDAAMEMEALCRGSGIPGPLIPLPRQRSAGCGIAWRMEAAVFAQYRAEIARSKIEIEQSVELAL